MEADTEESSERPFGNTKYDLADAYSRFFGGFNVYSSRNKDEITQDIQSILSGKTFVETEYDLAKKEQFAARLQQILYKQSPERAIAIAYRAVFKREPDSEGIRIYSDQLRNNRPVKDFIEELLHSDEYQQKALDQIYAEVLEREVDEIGRKIYLDQLRAGRPLPEIAQEIKRSEEYKNINNRNDHKIVFNDTPLDKIHIVDLKTSALVRSLVEHQKRGDRSTESNVRYIELARAVAESVNLEFANPTQTLGYLRENLSAVDFSAVCTYLFLNNLKTIDALQAQGKTGSRNLQNALSWQGTISDHDMGKLGVIKQAIEKVKRQNPTITWEAARNAVMNS